MTRYGLSNISENLTTEDTLGSALRQQGYTALYSVLLILLVPPQLFLSVLTIAGLCTGKTFRKIKAQRNLMILMAGMGFVSSVSELMLVIAEYLFVHGFKELGVIFCHGASWFINLSGGMRMFLLTALSVTVYIILKHGHKKIKSILFYISLVGMLMVVIILGIPHLVPAALNFSTPLDGAICFVNPSPAGYAVIGLNLLVGIPVRCIMIGGVVASVVFVKRHHTTISEHKQLKMAMIKLAACLITLHVILTIANYIIFTPFIIILVAAKNQINVQGVGILTIFSHFISLSTSAIATPLAMMIVFKPLQKETKRMLFMMCCRDIDKKSNAHSNTSTSTPHSASKAKPTDSSNLSV